MTQPVKLSDTLVLDARLVGQAEARSIGGQVEFWARIGRAIEPLMQGAQALKLCRAAAATPLSVCLEEVDSPQGRHRMAEHLKNLPYPHYESDAQGKGLIVRIEADGKRTVGRFVNRRFQAAKTKSSRR